MKILLYSLGLQLLTLVLSEHLPDSVPRCYRNDEDLENCLLSMSEIIKPHLQEGFPEYHIPSLEPLVVPSLDLTQKTNEFRYKVHLENFTIIGLSNYKFEKLKYNPKTLTLYGRVIIAPILMSGTFSVKGNIVLVKAETEGRFIAPMGPIVAEFSIRGKPKGRGYELYYNPTKIQLKMDIDDIAVLSLDMYEMPNSAHTSLVKTFNENSKIILPQITPVVEEVFGKLTLKYVSMVTDAVPYSKLLPIR